MRSGGEEQKILFKAGWIGIFVFLILFKIEGHGVSPRFYFFVVVSGVNQGMRRKGNYKISLCDLRGGKFFRELLKITGNVLWKWSAGGVVIAWVYGFYNRRLIRGEVLWIANLRLEQALRNLTGGDQEILLTLILMLQMRVETEKISY